MLMPKRVKHRKVQRGRMKGKATRGNFLAYGDFGIQAQTCGWITSNQIESARIAINRYITRITSGYARYPGVKSIFLID